MTKSEFVYVTFIRTTPELLWSALTVASVIAVNVTRIALTGMSRSSYEAIHSSVGGEIFGAIILAITVGFSILSARRELFSRG